MSIGQTRVYVCVLLIRTSTWVLLDRPRADFRANTVGWLHSASTCNAIIILMMLIVFFWCFRADITFFGKGFSLPSTIIVQTSLLFWNLLNEFTFKRLHVGLLRPTTV